MKIANGHDDPQHWTPEYAFAHLTQTFNKAFKDYPELMEPYVNRMATDDREQLTRIMREGLAATVKQRYAGK